MSRDGGIVIDLRAGRLEARQHVARPLEEVFAFFSEARNLERITPPFLTFVVRGMSTPVIQEGTLIRYRLRLRGIPLGWVSRIERWVPPVAFSDRQVRGPYREWYHEHGFVSEEGGTRVTDRVRFRLPLHEFSGRIMGPWIAADLRRIFEYRQQAVRRLLE